MKKWIVILCLSCILLSCLAGCGGQQQQEQVTPGTYISLIKAGENLAIIYNDTLIVTEYAYHRNCQLTLSRNGDYGLCKTSEGALLYIHDGEAVKLTDQVENYRMNAAGTTVLFQETEGGSLQLHQKSTGKTETISNGYIRDSALSPDGQTVAYLTSTSEWESDYQLFVQKTGGERKELALKPQKWYRLISINDTADLMYLLVDSKVISMDGEGNTTLVRNEVREKRFYSNADHTQLMFYADGVGTCLSTLGQVSATVTDQWLEPVEPTGVHFVTNGTDPEMVPFVFGVLQTTCHFQDLSGQMLGAELSGLNSGHSFWLPNTEGVYTQMAQAQNYGTQWPSYYLDPQGRFLYYMSTDENGTGIYYANLTTGATPVKLVEGVYHYAVRSDGTGVYSIHNGLFFHSTAEGAESQRLLDTDSATYCYVSENNRVFICRSSGKARSLFALSEDGTKAELLLENVDAVIYEECGMIYIRAGEAHYVIRAGELIKLQIKN